MTASRLAIVGYGRMGRAVEELAPERGWSVVARFDGGTPITRDALAGADVAVEFSEPAAAADNVRALAAAGCATVCGTTGWYDRLEEVSAEVRRQGGALLWAPNFALGVALFARLAEVAGRLFGAAGGFDAHLTDVHHSAKRDAPSGTARMLADRVAGGLRRELPITSIRTGHVPGTHELHFDAPFESVRLVHEARDRRVFADGALVAARWLVGRRGVFELNDLLNDQPTA